MSLKSAVKVMNIVVSSQYGYKSVTRKSRIGYVTWRSEISISTKNLALGAKTVVRLVRRVEDGSMCLTSARR